MGRVYEAHDTLLGNVPVAVKVLSRALMDQRARVRFEREARICAQLSQKSLHVVRVTDYGVSPDDAPFYVMEYLQGRNLRETIGGRPLLLPRFLALARQICLGLQCAHNGIALEDGEICQIVHRDLKPANILILPDESLDELVKILDFGIAKYMSESQQGLTSAYMGTLAYSSPEQMEGRTLDSRSDIYSLGIILYEMLTGRMPLAAESYTFGSWYKAHHYQPPRALKSANPALRIPPVLENLVMRCLAKAPLDRPQSVSDILRTLDSLEQRSTHGRQLGEQIGVAMGRSEAPTTTKASTTLRPEASPGADLSPASLAEVGLENENQQISPATAADVVCMRAPWPDDKPQAEIVFPEIIPFGMFGRQNLPTLWTMLELEQIHARWAKSPYNQFLFLGAPHPMILWVTALYSVDLKPRWMPCYLDLKTPKGQHLTRLLGEQGEYRLLLFAQGDPGACRRILRSTVAPIQKELLLDWANAAQLAPEGQVSVSKKLLKAELDKVKVRFMTKLDQISREPSPPQKPRESV
ncbi:serine/threonine protein kinase [Leptolyngbya sp. FACHB-261]|nr:serine/threonine protein kinase [Leptolyngbya sp. FACHB-261]